MFSQWKSMSHKYMVLIFFYFRSDSGYEPEKNFLQFHCSISASIKFYFFLLFFFYAVYCSLAYSWLLQIHQKSVRKANFFSQLKQNCYSALIKLLGMQKPRCRNFFYSSAFRPARDIQHFLPKKKSVLFIKNVPAEQNNILRFSL